MTGLCDFPLSKPSTIFIGRAAIRALHTELLLYPKPGLVSAVDNGAHDDMDAGTFLRSIFALRHYFKAIASAGAAGSPFPMSPTFGNRGGAADAPGDGGSQHSSRRHLLHGPAWPRRPDGVIIAALTVTQRLSRTRLSPCGATGLAMPAAPPRVATAAAPFGFMERVARARKRLRGFRRFFGWRSPRSVQLSSALSAGNARAFKLFSLPWRTCRTRTCCIAAERKGCASCRWLLAIFWTKAAFTLLHG